MMQNNVGQTRVGKTTGTGATAETGMSALQQTEVGQKVSQAFLTEKGQLTGPLAGCGPEVLDMAYAMATGQLRAADDIKPAKSFGALLNDPAVVARAAAGTHTLWLESSGAKPGVRFVKDDPVISMQKAGLNTTGIDKSNAEAKLKEMGLEMSPKHRNFAFAVDEKLNPVPRNAAEQRILNAFGADNIKKIMEGNNLPAIQGAAGAVANALAGNPLTFVKEGANYEAAARASYANAAPPPNAPAGDAGAKIDKLLSQVTAYQAALKAAPEGADIAKIGHQHAGAHNLAGAIHDQFTGYRKEKGIYMDDAQVIPYEKLTPGVAVLDLDPVIALLKAAKAELG